MSSFLQHEGKILSRLLYLLRHFTVQCICRLKAGNQITWPVCDVQSVWTYFEFRFHREEVNFFATLARL